MRFRSIALDSSMNSRYLRRATLLGLVVLAAGVGYTLHAARASGIPATGALVYTGILTDAMGAPLTSPQNVGVAIYDAQSAGTKVCERASQSTTLDPAGRFQIAMPDACAAAVGGNSDLWVEVSLAGAPLGRSKTGAVPYAIEANNATRLQGLTPSQLSPPAGMIAMFAGSCPAGWSPCDGSGGTPNLVDNYVKAGAAFAASAGSNSHTHTVSGQTSAAGGHYHFAEVDYTTDPAFQSQMRSFGVHANWRVLDSTAVETNWTATSRMGINDGLASGTGSAFVDVGGALTTTVRDHTHTVSGSAAVTSHEPQHVTLAFCMKN